MILAIFIGVLVLFFIAGIPAAFALGLTTLVVTIFERGLEGIPYTIVAQRMVYGVNSFPLLASPTGSSISPIVSWAIGAGGSGKSTLRRRSSSRVCPARLSQTPWA
jgi:hypothetical protein